MRTLKLTVAYDGTELVGWQRQKTGTSVQGLLEEGLARIDGAPVQVHGAGRTDAGVHAAAQVASASVTTSLECSTLRRALNAQLPATVRVLVAEDVEPGFHARFSSRKKTYRYLILEADTVSPFVWRYVWHVTRTLDVAAMHAAATSLHGTHDFSAFQSAGSTVTHAIRTVTNARVTQWSDTSPAPAPIPTLGSLNAARLLVFEVTANGFLRHMVRAMIGTLVEVGDGRRAAASIAAVLDGRARAAAGATAPASGLWLVSVDY
jgi:tRNA pseudouridine38-40 synthase